MLAIDRTIRGKVFHSAPFVPFHSWASGLPRVFRGAVDTRGESFGSLWKKTGQDRGRC